MYNGTMRYIGFVFWVTFLLGMVGTLDSSFANGDFMKCARELATRNIVVRPLTHQDIGKVAESLPEPKPFVLWRQLFEDHHLGAIAWHKGRIIGVAIAERLRSGGGIVIHRLQVLSDVKYPKDVLHGLIAQIEDALESGQVSAIYISEFAKESIQVAEDREYEKKGWRTTPAGGELLLYLKQDAGESFYPQYDPSVDSEGVSPTPLNQKEYDIDQLNPRRVNTAWQWVTEYQKTAQIREPQSYSTLTIKVSLRGVSDPNLAAVLAYEEIGGEYYIRALMGEEEEKEMLFRNLVRLSLAEGRTRVLAFCGGTDIEGMVFYARKGFKSTSKDFIALELR